MVRFQVAVGDATARITTRAKHPVLFDSPADRGAELKASFPDLGWIEDIEGHPTLPFSIAARLLLPYGADNNTRDTPLFTEFPGDKLFARFWASLAPKVNMAADNIFAELDRVFKSLDDTSTFLFTSGDWVRVEGDMGDGWDGLYRWVDCITRGDVFRLTPTHSSGLAAAELLYYVGPYMLEDQRNEDERHFALASKTLGKCFQSDADEELCDGAQLASEIADGLADSQWPVLFMHVTLGNDSFSDPSARGGPRISELRLRVGYHEASTSADASTTKFLTRILPSTVQHSRALPLISTVFREVSSGSSIAEGLVQIASALHMSSPRRIDDLSLRQMEDLLTPIASIITSADIAGEAPHNRISSVITEIESKPLSAKSSSSTTSSVLSSQDGEKPTAAGKLLLSQLTKADAIELQARLSAFRISSDYDPTTYLEMAHSNRWTPEQRAKRLQAATSLTDAAEKRKALADLAADDKREPIPALLQLAWGHVKALEGYPELQDIYDLGQTHMPDVLARVVARAFSADNKSVPQPLRFARAIKLHTELKGRTWDDDVDFINDADACMVSYLEGGNGIEINRVSSDALYTDISQVLRTKRIGSNILAFFGVLDSDTKSWRQLVASCEHAFMLTPSSDSVKRARLGRAMQRFVRRSLGDVGKRIDLVRYTAKHDAVGPRYLLSSGKGGPAEEFAEAVTRIAEDQKRKRSEVADDEAGMCLVCLPVEAAGKPAAKKVSLAQPGAPQQPFASATAAATAAAAAVAAAPATDGKWTKVALFRKPPSGRPGPYGEPTEVRVDAAAATRWLKEHGVDKPCIHYQIAQGSSAWRHLASCPSRGSSGHTEEKAGPHAFAEGWKEAAPKFIHPGDKAKYKAAA